jgi:hypothetical protein
MISNSQQALAANSPVNPFLTLISQVGSAGNALNNAITQNATTNTTEKRKEALSFLHNELDEHELAFKIPAMASHGIISAASGDGLKWLMSNPMEILRTASDSIEGISESAGPVISEAKNIYKKCKWYGSAVLIAAVVGTVGYVLLSNPGSGDNGDNAE